MKFTIKNPTCGALLKRIFSVKNIPKQPGYEWLNETVAIIRFGRKVIIDLDYFDTWVESHKSGSYTPK